ncbi:xanthine dehydrogenase family protein molybdopterin-binding subunit [Nannocystis sp. ILAH1]|uniref:xanthine dehydrogenase family protein molybdopterin-binding subunit n=1 Tax=Nannocystis sp. ILAH1 TaxID=2996789 RepID=UPI00226EE03D|nr:xanthine dehydrogenase family protein molybdopterin-binding subunit [Nannocystis sp. ILAH1]
MTTHVGERVSRVDGRAKVTGKARYAAEHAAPDLVHGFVIGSAVARGTITRIDASQALALPGVLQVFTHENAPRLARGDKRWRDELAPPGSPFRPLQDAQIRWSGQPIALVVADSLELARHAASLVRVEVAPAPHETDLEAHRERAYKPPPHERPSVTPPSRGSADKAFARAPVRVQAEYRVPVEHHNPMEPFATTVVVDEDGTLTVYDKTQGVQNVQSYLTNIFGAGAGEIRVLAPFVGGAFGSGLRPQYQVVLAVLAARQLQRSVRVALTRQQMFTIGHRPTTWQRLSLAATRDGALAAAIHEAVAETSRFEDYSEAVVDWTGLMYRCDNVRFAHEVVALDLFTPMDMRAPGAMWGVYALECAMDELAVALGVDPLELRLVNYAERDGNEKRPYSSKELRACYHQAAERFGWSQRDPEPRSMRDGDLLVGWGMATGAWESTQRKASARAVLTADGRLAVASATEDIGTGTYTAMTQIAADALGLPLERVTFKLGDSALASAPVEGGSFTVASVGSAVDAVCRELRSKLLKLAQQLEGSPLARLRPEDVEFIGGLLRARADPSRALTFAEVLHRAGIDHLADEVTTRPSKAHEKYSRYTHSAAFAEVKVDPELGTIRVTRVVTAIAGGRVINPKTAESQVIGSVVWGIGAALQEHSVIDHALGRFITHNLADYHVPVHADVPDIEVILVEERDEIVNALGAKGLGEIGVVAVAPAIANAVWHATGKRIRELPITLDKLL